MSLKALHTFATICKLGSFAEAAEALGRTQSAISMQIKALEAELGVPLFDRGSRPPRLTQHGRAFLARGRDILVQYEAAVASLSTTLPFHDTFELGVIPTALTGMAPAALSLLAKSHPDAKVNMVAGMTGSLVDLLRDGALDAALVNEPHRLPPNFQMDLVAEQRLIVVAPENSSAATDREALGAHPYIRFHRKAYVAETIQEHLMARNISVRQSMEIESLDAIHRMVHAGLGVSIVPEQIPKDPFMPPAKVFPFGEPPVTRRIGMLYHRDTVRRQATKALVDVFQRVVTP